MAGTEELIMERHMLRLILAAWVRVSNLVLSMPR